MTQLNLANYQRQQALVEAWGDVVDVRRDQADEWREMGWGSFGSVQSTGRPDDRLGGKLRPIFETEQDLDELRAISRIIADSTVPGIAALTNLTNYVIGKGFSYKAVPKKGVDDTDLADEVQAVIDEFLERDRWCLYRERELFRSSRRDGEHLLWLKDDGGFTSSQIIDVARIREPEQLPPAGTSWSFGVETDADNLEDVAGYHVQWDDFTASLDFLDAGDVFHLKLNVDSGVKRGVSDFFAINPELPSIRKLLRNMVRGGSVQAAIAYIVEHATGVTQSQVESMRSNSATMKYDQATQLGTKQRYVVEDKPGTRVDVGKGQIYKGSPLANGEAGRAFVEILSAGLRSVGSRWCMAEYMISGDASNANYASTKEAGTPFVKNCEAEQAVYCDEYRRVMWRVVKNACQAGRISRPFAKVRQRIEIQVEPPAVVVRDPDKETVRRQILRQEGILSPMTWAAQENLDYDQEVKNGAKKVEAMQSPAASPGVAATAAALESVRTTDEALAILSLMECGGKGGKPGPCPTGQRKKTVASKATRPQVRKTATVSKPKEKLLSDRAARAKASHNPSTKEKQDASEQLEHEVTKALGGVKSDDNRPMDVTAKGGKIGLEVKMMHDAKEGRVNMRPDSRARKEAWIAEQKGRKAFTVLVDNRDQFQDGKYKHLYSGTKYYWKAGVGAFTLPTMNKAGSLAEIKKAIGL